MANPIRYLFDRAVRLFRSIRGRLFPPAVVRQGIDDFGGAAARADLDAAARQFAAGSITPDRFVGAARSALKSIHVAAGTIAAGGRKQLRPPAVALIEGRLRAEYAFLAGMMKDVAAGRQALGDGFVARVAQYGAAGTATYELVRREAEIAAGDAGRERRVLHSAEPCGPCIDYAARGWVPIGTLPGIGQDCSCHSRCKCTFEYERSVAAMGDERDDEADDSAGPDAMFDGPTVPVPASLWDLIASFARGGKSGGKGKLSGGHWATIHGHPIYIKGGKIVAGGVPGLTHGKDGTPHGPVKPGGHTIQVKPKGKGGVHPEIAAARASLDKKAKGRQDRKVAKAQKELHAARKAHADAKKALDDHNAKAARGPGKSADKPAGGRSYTSEQYAAKHGMGSASAYGHLESLHKAGKVAYDKHSDSYFVPAGTKAPKGGKIDPAKAPKATPKAAQRAGKASDKALEAAQRVHDATAKTDAMRKGSIAERRADHAGKVAAAKDRAAAAKPADDGRRTVKSSAPRDAHEAAIHADAKARGKAAMVVTKTPEYRADKSGGKTHHVVGGKRVASHESRDGKHVVTVHHDDGTRTEFHHKTKASAKAHLEHVARKAIRSGTTRTAVVGGDLSKFDAHKHGLAGKHHRTTARVLGDGKHVKFDDEGGAIPARPRRPLRPIRGDARWPDDGPPDRTVDVPDVGAAFAGLPGLQEDAMKAGPAIHDLATFDLDAPADDSGEWVTYPNSLLFRAGDYPKKSFSLTPDELRHAAESFAEPVPNELEHVNSQGIATILDGKLGRVTHVRASEDGTELRGTVVIPRWLDAVWGEGAKKVSCVWDRADKSLRKLGLVIQGHVPDAALMAAFSEAEFATPRKRLDHMTAAWQSIHDQAALVPGICPSNPVPPPDGQSPAMMGDLTQQHKHLKAAHDHATEHGAVCPGMARMSEPPTSRSRPMPELTKNQSFLSRLIFGDKEAPAAFADHIDDKLAKQALARFADNDAPAVVVPVEEVAPAVVASFADSDEYREMKARLDAAELAAADSAKALDTARAERVRDEAAAFAKAEIVAHRAFAAEFSALEADYVEAAEADAQSAGTVTFSFDGGEAKTGSRVDRLKARQLVRPAHGLADPAMGNADLPEGSEVLFGSRPADAEANRQRADALLETTPEGRALLKRRAERDRRGR